MNSAVVGNLKLLLSLDSSNFDKGVTSSEANVKKLSDRLSKDLAPSQQRINSLIRDFVGNKEITKALEYAKAVESVGGANKLTASEQGRTNRVVQEAIEKYRVLGQEAPKHLIDLANATKQVNKPTEDLGVSMTSVLGKAKALAGVFGVTLGAGALVSFAKHTFDAADQIGDLATKMGVSVEAAQRFGFAARQSGADIEQVSASIVKMSQNLADGDKSTVGALTAAGLKFQDIRAMKPEDAFRTIAEAIAKIPDPMLQAKVAMELFGKSGVELLPMIREGSLQVADGVRVMSNETVQALKDAKQAWENFWDDITVMTGTALASMGPQIKQFLTDLREGFTFLSRVSGGLLSGDGMGSAITKALAQGQIDALTRSSAASAGMDRLRQLMTDPSVMSSHGPKVVFRTKEEIEAAEKKAKDAAGSTRKFNQSVSDYIKEIYTGMTAAQRQQEAVRTAALSRLGLTSAAAWGQSIVGKSTNWDALLGGGISFGREMSAKLIHDAMQGVPIPILPSTNPNAFGSIVNPIDIKKLTKGALGLDDMLRGVTVPNPSFSSSLQGVMALMPQTVLASFQGGGNVGKSIGAMVGSELTSRTMGKLGTDAFGRPSFTSGFGKQWQSALDGKAGGAVAGMAGGIASLGMSKILSDGGGKGMMSNIGSYAAAGMMFGPWGAAIGAGIGAIVGVFKKGQNATKKAREDYAKELGFEGVGGLYDKLRSLGAEGEKLANIGLNVIGKQDTKGNEKWMKDVDAFFKRLEKVPGKVQELSSALGKFGGAIPTQLEPLFDSILGNPALSDDLRRQLQGFKKPSWQAALEMAEAFGVDPAALGSGFNRERLADSAFQLKRAIDAFGRFEGSDRDAALRGLADEFSGIAREAKRTNVALPKAVEAFIRQVSAMGLLIDENGDQIDLALLRFEEMDDEYEKEVVSLLGQIRDLLTPPKGTPPVPGLPPGVPGPGGPHPLPPGFGGDRGGDGAVDPGFVMPGFAGGTHGQFFDFGAGTPVMLHGKERVMTAGEGMGGGPVTINLHVTDVVSFETFLRQRGGAEAVVRTIPGVVERWGRAQ